MGSEDLSIGGGSTRQGALHGLVPDVQCHRRPVLHGPRGKVAKVLELVQRGRALLVLISTPDERRALARLFCCEGFRVTVLDDNGRIILRTMSLTLSPPPPLSP